MVLGIGTAVPPGVAAQRIALEFAKRTIGGDEEVARALPALYRRSGVEQRGSVLVGDSGEQAFFAPSESAGDRGPGTGARVARYAAEAPALAGAAARSALTDAKVDAARVTHLVTASCTGFDAPGVDVALIEALGLPRVVQRTHVGFMGCHGAINALRVGAAFADQDAEAVVIVCAVEVCSVHYQYGSDPERIVANALFADGAAAAVLGQEEENQRALNVRGFGSLVLPESAELMRWRIGDHGFEMMLSARVPEVLRSSARPWVSEWLGRHGLRVGDIGAWCVHPGGPRILSAVAEGLELPEGALAESRAVLAEHGNMSSPTVLFILDRLRRAGRVMPGKPCVMLAFGPGLVIEAALIG